MCGIYGHIVNRSRSNSALVCMQGLKRLEYRGYDSAGIAGISHGKIISYKSVGKLGILDEEVRRENLELDMAIAHVRWATHGGLTKVNAHPHYDENNTIALVHNGIIENYRPLKEFLIGKGVRFSSDTDTEVVSQLIAYYYQGNLLKALQQCIPMLKGSFALAIIHKDLPNTIIATARGCPLVVGISQSTKDVFISSDSNALLDECLDIFYLFDDEIAFVKNEQIEVYNKSGIKMAKNTETIKVDTISATKGHFEHFLLKEIYEQPIAIRNALKDRIDFENASAKLEELTIGDETLANVKHILILACGSAYHAGRIGASIIESIARIPTQVEIASEFRYANPIVDSTTLVIAISQSGETADTLGAMKALKERGIETISLCNTKKSSIERESKCTISLKAGPEISVCSTKAFSCQLTVMMLIALKLARLKGMSKEVGASFISELQMLPVVVEQVLQTSPEIERLAKQYKEYRNFFLVGRQHMFPTCLEGALKLKEITYFESSAYPAGEMKHGPIALISPEHPTIALCGNAHTFDKLLSNLMEIRARGGPILAFAPKDSKEIYSITEDVVEIPGGLSDLFTPIPYAVGTQILAYHIAKLHNRDIDQPRNLAKSVTVE